MPGYPSGLGAAYVDEVAQFPYRIEFYDPNGSLVSVSTVYAIDYVDACDQGWDNLPDGADDFQITSPPPDKQSAG